MAYIYRIYFSPLVRDWAYVWCVQTNYKHTHIYTWVWICIRMLVHGVYGCVCVRLTSYTTQIPRIDIFLVLPLFLFSTVDSNFLQNQSTVLIMIVKYSFMILVWSILLLYVLWLGWPKPIEIIWCELGVGCFFLSLDYIYEQQQQRGDSDCIAPQVRLNWRLNANFHNDKPTIHKGKRAQQLTAQLCLVHRPSPISVHEYWWWWWWWRWLDNYIVE